MARPLRIWYPGAWYHVTVRGNERREIFGSEADREWFLARLAETVERFETLLHSYVLMGNHFHLLLEPQHDSLSRAMQWLNVSYSQWFNRRQVRSGHLFQGRFKAVVVDWQGWGLELSRYLHLNPVRTGEQGLDRRTRQRHRAGVGQGAEAEALRTRLKSLRSYRWSSYRAFIGLERRPAWLSCKQVLELMGGRQFERVQAYQRFVEEALLEGAAVSPWEQVRGQTVLGDEDYVRQLEKVLEGDEREQAGLKQLRRRPGWEAALKVVEGMKKAGWLEFRDRYGDWGRDVALWLGRRRCGMKLKELAEVAGLGHYASVGTALKLLEQRRANDAQLDRLMRHADKLLNSEM